jgi:hypothetical protein
VCERRVDLLVCSLPLHRHSYIGFILDFASSIHNKQLLIYRFYTSSIHNKQHLIREGPCVLGPRPYGTLCIPPECWRSTPSPLLNGHLHYPRPDDIDQPLNEASTDKIRDFRPVIISYNNRPSNSISFIPTPRLHRLHCELVLIVCSVDCCFRSPLRIAEKNQDKFHYDYRHTVFYSQLKSKVGNILTKDEALRIKLNIDDCSMTYTYIFPDPPSVCEVFRSFTFRV